MIFRIVTVVLFMSSFSTVFAQDDPDLGAWYMYFGGFEFEDSQFGIHAEAQYRNHNFIGDLEQLLLRTGVRYHLKDGSATFTFGYGNITTQAVGEPNNPVAENRIYQEALLKQNVSLASLNHRFRYEQRFVEGQDFRTRFRYALFINIPLTSKKFAPGGFYIPIYNEVFINGEKMENIEYFDRNRLYGGLGYVWKDNTRVQLGIMEQTLNFGFSKTQLQFSLHHNFQL
ncbi:DUF2490 domain-containing protein [Marivirga harenae]|uniref:DUF2490 domain-containing protein n=1 Tax=Marivirga harenae TaxID=2010992 RepID=UPI0026DF9ED4|nr:DUF2490 domain-containing protein [Marivirga harenae]WKV13267.1 DUF2490 domain-containing protein [Marivirga harenae]|tara:strand:+ start:80966 stop:81649 length:684 start_codon:yes stop_codon:yes gene_type:complete